MAEIGRAALTIVGYVFFGPVGALVGGILGDVLFPQAGVKGPRLNELNVQHSTVGAPIPIVYGTAALAGNVIWSGGLIETKHEDEQGGMLGIGGPTVTSYTYSVDVAIGICEGPISGIRRIWADADLIYDASDDATLEERLELGGVVEDIRGRSSRHPRAVRATRLRVVSRHRGPASRPDDRELRRRRQRAGLSRPRVHRLQRFPAREVRQSHPEFPLRGVRRRRRGVRDLQRRASASRGSSRSTPIRAIRATPTTLICTGYASGDVPHTTCRRRSPTMAAAAGRRDSPDVDLHGSATAHAAIATSTAGATSIDAERYPAVRLASASTTMRRLRRSASMLHVCNVGQRSSATMPLTRVSASATVFWAPALAIVTASAVRSSDTATSEPATSKAIAATGSAAATPAIASARRHVRSQPIDDPRVAAARRSSDAVAGGCCRQRRRTGRHLDASRRHVPRPAGVRRHRATSAVVTAYPVGPALRIDDPNYNDQDYWEAAYAEALAAGEPIAPGLVYGVDYPDDAELRVLQASATAVDGRLRADGDHRRRYLPPRGTAHRHLHADRRLGPHDLRAGLHRSAGRCRRAMRSGRCGCSGCGTRSSRDALLKFVERGARDCRDADRR